MRSLFTAFLIILCVSLLTGTVAYGQTTQGASQSGEKPRVVSPVPYSGVEQPVQPTAAAPIPYLYETTEQEMLAQKSQALAPGFGGGTAVADPNIDPETGTLGPYVGTGFAGVPYTGWMPPDPVVAVGPNHVISVVNESWRIFNKNGTAASGLMTFTSWFGSGYTSIFDPKVVYDPVGQRYIMMALGINKSTSASRYMISVSGSSNAMGSWWIYSLDATANGSTITTNWADFPGLGFDGSAVYITSNQYTMSTNSFQYAKLRILNKATMYAGGSLGWYDFWNFTNSDGSAVFTWKPAQTFGSASAEYLINTKSGGWDKVTLWALTNPLGTPTLTRQSTITIGAYTVPPNACQSGGSNLIATGDCRTQDVAFRGGFLYTAFTVGYNWGSGTVAAIRILKINTGTNAADKNTTYGANGFSYFYPAAFVNASGVMYVGFNRSSCSEFVEMRAITEYWIDAASSAVKYGNGYYSQDRWGDYCGIGLDPATGTMWFTAELPTTTATTWSTWIAELSATPFTVQCTVKTNPAGLAFSVDGVAYTSQQIFTWNKSSSHTIATTTPQSGAAGVRYTWANWSDAGAISHTVAPATGTTYTANFTTQYYLTMSASTGGTVSPASHWGNSGEIDTLKATANGGYTFTGWTGSGTGSYTGTANPAIITLGGPISELGSFYTPTTWVVKAAMSVARSRAAVASTANAVYVIGGESVALLGPQSTPGDGITQEAGLGPMAYSATIEEYYPSTGTWAVKAAKPTGVSNVSAATINSKIYVPGGYTGVANAVLEIYNPSTNAWTTGASMPVALFAHATASVGGKLYVFGGTTDGVTYLDTCLMYDPSTNTWSARASMTYARGYLAAGVVNGKIYVVGGRDNATPDFNYVEVYDPSTNTWATKAPMGTARGGPGAVGFGSYLYVAGGGWGSYLTTCEKYDPATNTWSIFDPLNVGRRTLGAAEVNGKLYAEAGYTGDYSAVNEENGSVCTSISVTIATNPASLGIVVDAVSYAAPHTFAWCAGVSHTIGTSSPQSGGSGTQYVWTGWNDAGAISHSITPTKNATYTATFKTQYSLMMTTTTGGTVSPVSHWADVGELDTIKATANPSYTFAGWAGSGTSSYTGILNPAYITMSGPVTEMALFTTGQTSWVIKTSMGIGRSRPAVAATGGKVYVIGGESATALAPWSKGGDGIKQESPAGPEAWETTLEEYNPTTDTWTTKALKPTGVSNVGAAVIDGKIYVPGGYTGSVGVKVLEIYDPSTNTWSSGASMPASRYAHAVAATGGKLYVFGGADSVGAFQVTSYMYDPATNTWSTRASMTNARGYLGAGVVNGLIYVVGGLVGSSDVNYVEVYNPSTNTWQTKAAMGTARGGPGVVGVGNYLYVAGGGFYSYLRTCEKYDPSTDTWSAFDSLNIGRRTLGMAEVNGKLYAEAGYSGYYSSVNEENGTLPAVASIVPLTTSPEYVVGDTFWVYVKVGDPNVVTDLYGVSFKLRASDSGRCGYVNGSADSGSFLGTSILKFFAQVDDSTVDMAVSKTAAPGVSGSGIVTKAKFYTRGPALNPFDVLFSLLDITATNSTGDPVTLDPATFTVHILSGVGVWPGDCDNTGIVSSADVLKIGIYYGQTKGGNPCPNNPGTQWKMYQRSPWTADGALPKRLYADANGDCTINSADVLAIGLNYGKTHAIIAPVTKKGAGAPLSFDGAIGITDLSGAVKENGTFTVKLGLNTMKSVFGISFKLKYRLDNGEYGDKVGDQFAVGASGIDKSGSVLGDVLDFSSVQNEQGFIDIALTRTEGKGFTGSGDLVSIVVRTAGTISPGSGLSLEVADVVANDEHGNTVSINGATWAGSLTSVMTHSGIIKEYSLSQNYPNPFNPTTEIRFTIKDASYATLKIYNILGVEVATLLDGLKQPGAYTAVWDARSMPSGIYTYRLMSGSFVAVKKMILLK